MPKAAPPKRFNWRLTFAILFGFVLFVSTAMATRRVQSMLLTNDRFALESDFLAPAAGGAPVIPGIRIEGNRYVSRERILHVFAPDVNKSIFRIPIAERRRRLLGIDWVIVGGESGPGAPYENSVGVLKTTGMGFGSLRVASTHSGVMRIGCMFGALEMTCASPCGNMMISPASRRTGDSPTIAAQPLPFVMT